MASTWTWDTIVLSFLSWAFFLMMDPVDGKSRMQISSTFWIGSPCGTQLGLHPTLVCRKAAWAMVPEFPSRKKPHGTVLWVSTVHWGIDPVVKSCWATLRPTKTAVFKFAHAAWQKKPSGFLRSCQGKRKPATTLHSPCIASLFHMMYGGEYRQTVLRRDIQALPHLRTTHRKRKTTPLVNSFPNGRGSLFPPQFQSNHSCTTFIPFVNLYNSS